MNVVVFTSDKYLPALRPFSWLFNRYWSPFQSVIVVGFAPPNFALPSNFSFHSLGDQARYPVTRWSDGVIDFLESRPDMHSLIVMLEDYWLTRHVNIEAVRICYDYTLQFRNVLKFDLMTDRLYAAGMTDYGPCSFLDIIKNDPSSPYSFSLMTGVWNRDLMLHFMRRGESPWDAEISGTPRVAAAGDEVLVLGTRQAPVRHILAHRNGDSGKFHLQGLRQVDLDELTRLGYIPY